MPRVLRAPTARRSAGSISWGTRWSIVCKARKHIARPSHDGFRADLPCTVDLDHDIAHVSAPVQIRRLGWMIDRSPCIGSHDPMLGARLRIRLENELCHLQLMTRKVRPVMELAHQQADLIVPLRSEEHTS